MGGDDADLAASNNDTSKQLWPNSNKIDCTFSNKARGYGEIANTWPYDKKIKKWFSLWNISLNSVELGNDFDKKIIQTNWSDSQDQEITSYSEFLTDCAINNFIKHITDLEPRVILLMGSELINYLNRPAIYKKFKTIMGNSLFKKVKQHKTIGKTHFKITFQKFEHCHVVCFPHPSGARGISDDYIASFGEDMQKILKPFI